MPPKRKNNQDVEGSGRAKRSRTKTTSSAEAVDDVLTPNNVLRIPKPRKCKAARSTVRTTVHCTSEQLGLPPDATAPIVAIPPTPEIQTSPECEAAVPKMVLPPGNLPSLAERFDYSPPDPARVPVASPSSPKISEKKSAQTPSLCLPLAFDSKPYYIPRPFITRAPNPLCLSEPTSNPPDPPQIVSIPIPDPPESLPNRTVLPPRAGPSPNKAVSTSPATLGAASPPPVAQAHSLPASQPPISVLSSPQSDPHLDAASPLPQTAHSAAPPPTPLSVQMSPQHNLSIGTAVLPPQAEATQKAYRPPPSKLLHPFFLPPNVPMNAASPLPQPQTVKSPPLPATSPTTQLSAQDTSQVNTASPPPPKTVRNSRVSARSPMPMSSHRSSTLTNSVNVALEQISQIVQSLDRHPGRLWRHETMITPGSFSSQFQLQTAQGPIQPNFASGLPIEGQTSTDASARPIHSSPKRSGGQMNGRGRHRGDSRHNRRGGGNQHQHQQNPSQSQRYPPPGQPQPQQYQQHHYQQAEYQFQNQGYPFAAPSGAYPNSALENTITASTHEEYSPARPYFANNSFGGSGNQAGHVQQFTGQE